MRRIGFINPPSEFLINQRVFISLGILRVATSLQKNHTIHFLDLSNENDYYSKIDNFISDNDLKIICITATTPQIQIVYEFCKYIKSKYNIKIILGGPHITLMHSSLNNGTSDIKNYCSNHINTLLKYIDNIVIGDGEYSIFDAIESDEKIINSEEIKNYYLPNNYDEVAIANRELIDISSYNYFIDGVKSTNLISQMGCPYQCEFCSGRGSKTFNKIRKRSIDNIIKEIDILYKNYDYKGFMFYDDELNINKKYFNSLLEKLIQYQNDNDVKFNLRGFTRSNLLDEEQAKLMYDAGFRWLLIGFESGSDRMLKNMNKGCSVDDNTKCFEIAKKVGLKVKALMSIGHPGETKETINETLNWLKKVKPDETDITIVSVYPGSSYFEKSILVDDKLLKYTNERTNDNLYIRNIDFLKDSNFYKSKSNEYISFVSTDELSEKDIIEHRLMLEKEIKNIWK